VPPAVRWSIGFDAREAKDETARGYLAECCSYIWTGAGKARLGFRYSITQHEDEVGLYINRDTEQENRTILNHLKSHQAEAEKTFGAPLLWYQQEGARHCRVAYIRLEKAVGPYLTNIKTE
jgi:hypothetical protein